MNQLIVDTTENILIQEQFCDDWGFYVDIEDYAPIQSLVKSQNLNQIKNKQQGQQEPRTSNKGNKNQKQYQYQYQYQCPFYQ